MAKATKLNTGLRIDAGTPYSLTMPSADAAGSLTSDGSGALSFTSAVVTYLAKTADYTVTTGDAGTDCQITVDASGAGRTITLYASSGNSGRQVKVKKIDSSVNTVTIDGNSSETIDGTTTKVISAQYTSLSLVCDGSNWHIF
jgi:hypothetical protein|tara:strand:+ start:1032 stop:1460 length:429 start_codon:yes stop_codon:yes gene_type:complete